MFDSRQDRVTRHHPVSYRQIACETLPVIPTLTILRLSAASFELSRNVVPTAADRLDRCGHRSLTSRLGRSRLPASTFAAIVDLPSGNAVPGVRQECLRREPFRSLSAFVLSSVLGAGSFGSGLSFKRGCCETLENSLRSDVALRAERFSFSQRLGSVSRAERLGRQFRRDANSG